MTLEPAGSPRLAALSRLAASEPVHDATHPDRSVPMSTLPSAPLARDIAACADCRARLSSHEAMELCGQHEAVWRFEQVVGARAEPMAGDVGALVRQVLLSGERAPELLDAFRRQAVALGAVWQAHRLGAARLPDEVAASVREALDVQPDFLGGRPTARSA